MYDCATKQCLKLCRWTTQAEAKSSQQGFHVAFCHHLLLVLLRGVLFLLMLCFINNFRQSMFKYTKLDVLKIGGLRSLTMTSKAMISIHMSHAKQQTESDTAPLETSCRIFD